MRSPLLGARLAGEHCPPLCRCLGSSRQGLIGVFLPGRLRWSRRGTGRFALSLTTILQLLRCCGKWRGEAARELRERRRHRRTGTQAHKYIGTRKQGAPHMAPRRRGGAVPAPCTGSGAEQSRAMVATRDAQLAGLDAGVRLALRQRERVPQLIVRGAQKRVHAVLRQRHSPHSLPCWIVPA